MEPELIPGRIVYSYQVSGPCFFAYDGKQVEAVEFYVEADPHYPAEYAIQIMTANNLSIIYESHNSDTWPSVARRLYRKHVSALRQAGTHA